ncbi:hypothetical protein [Agrococcus sp. KRD186]|jgi:hypothetical protein|uniref:hypothetical protein n=1 Tax=Agrococcus sp. KRD186 TaxID=2729730 RepID=UPI0019CFA60D|nr:hypothetical protein [Agrococcus sp. KRD186]
MEQTARIPNPVSGRIDDGYDTPPVTPLMIACRYGMTAWLPLYVLAGAPFDLQPPLWLLVVAMAVIILLAAGVNGGWLRTSRPSAWWGVHIATGTVVLVAWLWARSTGEVLVALVPALLVLGGVLGAAGMHVWLARRG